MESEAADNSEVKLYADGSGLEGNVGAAAALYRQGRQNPKVLRYCLGPLTHHTTYSAEAVGTSLALYLLSKELDVSSVSLNIDSQATITAMNKQEARSGQHIIEECIRLVWKCWKNNHQLNYHLNIHWISGHSGVEGNELVDEEAKRAAQGNSSAKRSLPNYLQKNNLPCSISASKQSFDEELKKRWETSWHASLCYNKIQG